MISTFSPFLLISHFLSIDPSPFSLPADAICSVSLHNLSQFLTLSVIVASVDLCQLSPRLKTPSGLYEVKIKKGRRPGC